VTPDEFAAAVQEIGTVRPGDALILRIRDARGPDELRRMSEDLKVWLPDNVRIVLVTDAIEVTILRTGDVA
jgi:hypothetical protein